MYGFLLVFCFVFLFYLKRSFDIRGEVGFVCLFSLFFFFFRQNNTKSNIEQKTCGFPFPYFKGVAR